jgi:hypothetical protein
MIYIHFEPFCNFPGFLIDIVLTQAIYADYLAIAFVDIPVVMLSVTH